ncbi:hypothetical protein G8C92_15130 [Paenibacillus donghaensis]|uniref:hypothetical protein n=1 Tax=Paenibacillus donghaensis TaxID=414771 RepID=UPI001883D26C|nr:hypothetical protein [Paenibacillus donghaensis]MBE9915353.1 hypothetical protein [Paenibacillus donghaensis]
MKNRIQQYTFAFLRKIAIFILLLCGLLFVGSSANANYFEDFYNGVEKFSELPGKVNDLKESYQQTLEELDRAKENAKAFEEQNAQLIEQNRQLAETVDQLKEANELKEAKARKFKRMLIAVIVLVAGYFIGIRLLRFAMQRSNRRMR